jgi:hypothetical protein
MEVNVIIEFNGKLEARGAQLAARLCAARTTGIHSTKARSRQLWYSMRPGNVTRS